MKIKEILNKQVPDILAYIILGLFFSLIWIFRGFEITIIFILTIIIVQMSKEKQEDGE